MKSEKVIIFLLLKSGSKQVFNLHIFLSLILQTKTKITNIRILICHSTKFCHCIYLILKSEKKKFLRQVYKHIKLLISVLSSSFLSSSFISQTSWDINFSNIF